MNNLQYWQNRTLEQQDIAFNKIAGSMDKILAKEYKRCFDEITTQLLLLYDELLASTGDGTILISDYYKYNTYYESLSVINKNLQHLGELELKLTEQKLN
jgi:hypothetical protein